MNDIPDTNHVTLLEIPRFSTLDLLRRGQEQNMVCAVIDGLRKLDLDGSVLRLDELLVAQPETEEQALDIADALVRCGAVHIVVLDAPASWSREAMRHLAAVGGQTGTQVVAIGIASTSTRSGVA